MNWEKEPYDALPGDIILAYAEGKTEEELIEELAQKYRLHPIRKIQWKRLIQDMIAQCLLAVDQNGKLKVLR
jgi:hypothetical protein